MTFISSPLITQLYEESASLIYMYRQEPFQLASGQMSNHYFNCKKITLHPGRLSLLAKAIRDEVLPQSALPLPKAAGGLTLGADPIAYSFSLACFEKGHVCMPIVVRKEAKGHGTARQIEGDLTGIDEVLVFDDVITTAGSTLKAVAALREAGLKVNHAICIVDRQEGGKEALEQQQVTLHSLYKKSDFAKANALNK